jgi:exodeoxyribonuclease VII large subunit
MDPGAQIISVSEFLGIINETLAFAYPQVIIEGEVSSFKVNQGKFIFFDLKEGDSVLNCFMMVHALKLPVEDGMKVRVTGSPKVMPKSSRFSLTVKSLELAGEGELRRAMELLKQKLQAEGLFAPERKRPLPAFPQRIGLITSQQSAAYSDFMKILSNRWGGLDIQLADVTVQGATAPDQIVEALEYFNTTPQPVDVVVLIRGGGSLEDLSAFSTEPVARAVAASRTPIIVGVGHEIDVSLADYAADVRAATPSNAAQLIVPDRTEVAAQVGHLHHRTVSALERTLHRRSTLIDAHAARLERYLRLPRERAGELAARLWRGFERLAASRTAAHTQVAHLQHRLLAGQHNLAQGRTTQLHALTRQLQAFNPEATLSRGYAIARNAHGHILRDPATVTSGAAVTVQLAKGSLDTVAK